MSLCGMAKRISYLKERTYKNPMNYFVPTPPQARYINDPSKVKLLLGGNQVGKTAASCYLLIAHCLGIHPTIKTDPPPIETFLVTHSHEQSRTIQQKLFDMIPKETLHPSCEFVRGRGFRGLAPVVRFRNNSIIRIKTANQGLGLASSTASLVVIDEPVPMDVFNELLARTLRGGRGGSRGVLAQSMTPVGNVDVSYIEEMIDQGKISVTKAKLTLEDTTPIGLEPLLSQHQIDEVTNSFLPIDREARINGSFDVAPLGVIFKNFTEEMISDYPPPLDGKYEFCIGIDHGQRPNSQVAILCAVDLKDQHRPKVYVLDEYTSGEAPPEAHARGIFKMLDKHQIPMNKVRWTGDSEHRGRNGYKMSNLVLMRAMESVLRLPHKGLPFYIRTAIKKRHSVYFGASMLHSIMARKDFYIRSSCQQLIKSIKNWTMKRSQSQRSTDKYGHAIDGLRYGVLPVIDKRNYSIPSKIPLG